MHQLLSCDNLETFLLMSLISILPRAINPLAVKTCCRGSAPIKAFWPENASFSIGLFSFLMVVGQSQFYILVHFKYFDPIGLSKQPSRTMRKSIVILIDLPSKAKTTSTPLRENTSAITTFMTIPEPKSLDMIETDNCSWS